LISKNYEALDGGSASTMTSENDPFLCAQYQKQEVPKGRGR